MTDQPKHMALSVTGAELTQFMFIADEDLAAATARICVVPYGAKPTATTTWVNMTWVDSAVEDPPGTWTRTAQVFLGGSASQRPGATLVAKGLWDLFTHLGDEPSDIVRPAGTLTVY